MVVARSLPFQRLWPIHTPHRPPTPHHAAYWGLDNRELVSVWVALADASEEAGCMSVLPGSHQVDMTHDETYDEDNLLTRGQHI